MADVGVAVNLSIAQLAQAGLVEEVQAALVSTGLAPERLTLEITESMLMVDPARGIRVLEELRALGVQLAIDDFGTGYSSLTYLRRFPVGKVKLDQSFIANIANREEERHIVSGVISMVHSLGLTVVAEGVETVDQHRLLQELHCDEVQGYLLGRPMPVARLLARAGATVTAPSPGATSRALDPAAAI
jgi:EAL domain-containing protein (putative c-di-GMP-specific phosphodiesterase class I)